MNPSERAVAEWSRSAPFSPLDVDCAVTLMLKIIDGKCRMNDAEKGAMVVIYDQLRDRPGERLGPELRELIAEARGSADEVRRMAVYEQRVLAETIVSRPVMKAYKARLRTAGVL